MIKQEIRRTSAPVAHMAAQPAARRAARPAARLAARLAALVALFAAPAAFAEEKPSYPYVEFNLSIEVENDWNFSSEDSANRHNQLYTTTEPEFTFHLFPGLSIYAHAVLEPVTDPNPRQSRYFRGHGLYMQDLYIQYETEVFKNDYRTISLRVWGGKFTPQFGVAWDKAPGIFGTGLAEDYELAERIGFGGAITLSKGRTGTHTLAASVFFLDTSFFSESLITNRGRTHRADGGPSNTESLESFHISLTGDRIPGLSRVGYHIGLVRQAVDGGRAETGLAIALHTKLDYDEFSFTPLFEVAHFWNADGVGGQSRLYLTAGFEIGKGPWTFSVSSTLRRTSATGAALSDYLVQTTLGYDIGHGVGIAVGYGFTNDASINTHTFGVLLTYSIGGTLSRRGFKLAN